MRSAGCGQGDQDEHDGGCDHPRQPERLQSVHSLRVECDILRPRKIFEIDRMISDMHWRWHVAWGLYFRLWVVVILYGERILFGCLAFMGTPNDKDSYVLLVGQGLPRSSMNSRISSFTWIVYGSPLPCCFPFCASRLQGYICVPETESGATR